MTTTTVTTVPLIEVEYIELPPHQNPALVYLATLESEESKRVMRRSLDLIARTITEGMFDHRTFPWHRLRYSHTATIRTMLRQLKPEKGNGSQLAPATVNKALCALRRVLKEAWQLGLMEASDYQAAVNIRPVRYHSLPSGRYIQQGEMGALFRACSFDNEPAGIRDAAILFTLAAGLRRSEVAFLDLVDFDPLEESLIVREGKRRKDRITYLPPGGSQAMADWLDIRGHSPGALFWAINKGGRLIPGRITAQAILLILEKRAKLAGVGDISPHDFRRTFISDLLDRGNDIATVQQLVGHASPETTARYDRRGEKAKKRAVSTLDIPYQRQACQVISI